MPSIFSPQVTLFSGWHKHPWMFVLLILLEKKRKKFAFFILPYVHTIGIFFFRELKCLKIKKAVKEKRVEKG